MQPVQAVKKTKRHSMNELITFHFGHFHLDCFVRLPDIDSSFRNRFGIAFKIQLAYTWLNVDTLKKLNGRFIFTISRTQEVSLGKPQHCVLFYRQYWVTILGNFFPFCEMGLDSNEFRSSSDTGLIMKVKQKMPSKTLINVYSFFSGFYLQFNKFIIVLFSKAIQKQKANKSFFINVKISYSKWPTIEIFFRSF